MSQVLDGAAICSMCQTPIELAHAKRVLEHRPMRTRDIFECPECGYYVSVQRVLIPA